MGLREILFPSLSLSIEGQPGLAFECIFNGNLVLAKEAENSEPNRCHAQTK
jgi:hypothetical protein